MPDIRPDALAALFSELTMGPERKGESFILNTGDRGLLRSLDDLTASAASQSMHDGATIAAHAQHLRYGLSLMNRWAAEGGNPFADARWDGAWKVSAVDENRWAEIRAGLRNEVQRWRDVLRSPPAADETGLKGMIASIAHLAYHLGAIRQIDKTARGPREGTF